MGVTVVPPWKSVLTSGLTELQEPHREMEEGEMIFRG